MTLSIWQNTQQNKPLSPWRWLGLPLLLILGGLLLLPINIQAAPPTQEPDEMPSAVAGRASWGDNCLPCHGPTGQGDGPTAQELESPPTNFTDPEIARQLVPAENFETIKNGRLEKLMPPWGDSLSDAEIWDKVAYVWSLGVSPEALADGETLYLEQCTACHGENGTGDGPEATDDMIAFTDTEAMAQRSPANLQTNFKAAEAHANLTLPDETLWPALDFIRTFSYKVPQRNGVITGQVINATTNQPANDIELMLHAIQGQTEILTLSTRTDEFGHYTFDNLPDDHTLLYVVEGFYNDIAYLADQPAAFDPDQPHPQTQVDLKVYDTTSSNEAINITQMHYLISFGPNMISVIEVLVVGNSGNQTYIGQEGQTFPFSLPAEAIEIVFQNNTDNSRFVETDSGYTDTEPIVPDDEGLTIAALYDIPYDGDSLTVEVPLADDTASVDVLINNQQVELTSDQLQFRENRDFQGNTFAIYGGSDLSQGDSLTLNLTGLADLDFSQLPPDTPAHTQPGFWFENELDQTMLGWLAMGLGLLSIVAVGVVYPMNRARTAAEVKANLPDSVETRRQKLLLTLVCLDQAFEAGELDKAVYKQARSQYKTELLEIMTATS